MVLAPLSQVIVQTKLLFDISAPPRAFLRQVATIVVDNAEDTQMITMSPLQLLLQLQKTSQILNTDSQP